MEKSDKRRKARIFTLNVAFTKKNLNMRIWKLGGNINDSDHFSLGDIGLMK